MEIYKKITQAIDKIKNSDLKKIGYNDYSNYYYYTPEQVDKLVYDACRDLKLFIKFDLFRNVNGIDGQMSIIDIDNINEYVNYVMATDIPVIKATNITQQLGGAMTYTKRYMLMNVFNIVDNNLDFDTPQKKKPTTSEQKSKITEWLSDIQFKKAMESDEKGIKATLTTYDNKGSKGMKKEYRDKLQSKIKKS